MGSPGEGAAVYGQAWASFLQSMTASLDHRFRVQERLMQQCLRELLAARAGGSDMTSRTSNTSAASSHSSLPSLAAPWDSQSNNPVGAMQEWQSKLELSLRNIQAVLEEKVVPVLAMKNIQGTPGEKAPPAPPACPSPPTKDCLPVPCSSASAQSWPESPRSVGQRQVDAQRSRGSSASTKMKRLLTEWHEPRKEPKSAPAKKFVPTSHAGKPATAVVPSVDGDKREFQKETWQIVVEDKLEDYKRLYAQKTAYPHARILSWLEWWMKLEEPPRTGCLAALVTSKAFEGISALVIIMNTIFAAYATNAEISGHAVTEVHIMETCFLSFYAAELVLKLLVHRFYFFCTADARWNNFDLMLVLTAIYYELETASLDNASDGLDLSYMRVLRMLKLARILRVIRVAKVLSELRLMLNSIIGCVFSLFWSFVMLFLVFYIFGLMFVQGAASHLMYTKDLDQASRDMVLKTFGSVQLSMLSLFMATTGGADWENIFRSPLVEDLGSLYVALFIFLIAFIQVALLNILTGIFVENAIKLAQPDRETLALEQRKRWVRESAELRELFRVMDTDKSGAIEPEELHANIRDERLSAHLRVMGLDIKDAELFYKILLEEQGGAKVDIEDFVRGCMHMKGTASSLDVHALRLQLKNHDKRLRTFAEAVDTRLSQLSKVHVERTQRKFGRVKSNLEPTQQACKSEKEEPEQQASKPDKEDLPALML